MLKPTVADIVVAIAKVLCGAGNWIDPAEKTPAFWCRLYDADGELCCDGCADTAAEAMALAWIGVHAPDALWLARVRSDEVPYEVPAGWRFEVTPG